jgi:hypothetical protein
VLTENTKRPRNFKDITGQRIGRWLVNKVSAKRGTQGQLHWDCTCDCGTSRPVAASSLVKGLTVSCGCYARECTSLACKGKPTGDISHRKRPYESVYNSLCSGAKKRNYTVEITLDEYVEFTKTPECHYCRAPLKWSMYSRKENRLGGHNLDRMDNSKPYSPENCIPCCGWCNKSKNSHITYDQWYLMTEPFRDGRLTHGST